MGDGSRVRSFGHLLVLNALLVIFGGGCGCGGGGGSNPLAPDGGTPVTGLPNVPWYCFVVPCADAGVTTTPRCGPRTCSGCCDSLGVCQSGTLASACGVGGVSCNTCPDFTCEFGRCVTLRCGPATCRGCCLGESCVIGGNESNCGLDGVACRTCAPGNRCIDGRCETVCDTSNCSGCCDELGTCHPGNTQANCGTSGNRCSTCSQDSRCDGLRCVALPTCANCGVGQCCLEGACVDVSPTRCARNGGLSNDECRVCAGPETCGAGSEKGFCVRPGNRPLGASCSWDGDCAAGASGRPMCLTGLAWGTGYCSDGCTSATCPAPDVCTTLQSQTVCLKGCSTAGSTCSNPDTVCEALDGGALGCVPKCTASTANLQCTSGRCRGDGRCCGASGNACCETGSPCSGVSRDGGVSMCRLDGTCS